MDSEVERKSPARPPHLLSPSHSDGSRIAHKGPEATQCLGPQIPIKSDGITKKVLKDLSAPLICLLMAFFNAVLSNYMFPQNVERSSGADIPKPGKLSPCLPT